MATISNWSERMYSHIGTEIRPRRLRVGSSNESSAMRETLTERVLTAPFIRNSKSILQIERIARIFRGSRSEIGTSGIFFFNIK